MEKSGSERIIKLGAGKESEYKETKPEDNLKYLKTVVAFSNWKGGTIVFGIEDKTLNVVGIPKEKLSTIFNGGLSGVAHNNFDMKKNMGIGLSVCYTIVKAHGGTMTAENLDLGGACFRFYLPLEEGINSEIEG